MIVKHFVVHNDGTNGKNVGVLAGTPQRPLICSVVESRNCQFRRDQERSS